MKKGQILFSILYSKGVISTIVFVFLLSLFSSNGHAQDTCPSLNGGFRFVSFTDGDSHKTIFPGDIPSGLSGLAQSTVGYLTTSVDAGTIIGNRDITIDPRLISSGSTIDGSVVLKFDAIELPTPDSRVQVYSGTSVAGFPLFDISAANAATYFGTEIVISGAVTVRFFNPSIGSGDFDVVVKYMTGDQIITSCQGKEVAVWTAFMPSDGYTFVDDYGDPYGGNSAPICVGYFDENQQFVSSEVSLCLDHDRYVASVMFWYYPGEIVYTLNPNEDHDIDRSGAYNDTDKVKKARLLWILDNAPMSTKPEQLDAQLAVWSTLDNSLTHSFGVGSLAWSAQTNVPATPVPFEPEFSITAPITTAITGHPLDIMLEFDIDGASPSRVRLEPSAGVVINSVTGDGTYDPGTGQINFSTLPATVVVKVSSAIAQTGSIKAIYDEPDFWNLNNLSVYNSCSEEVQDFIGLESFNNVKPMREIAVSWEDAPLSVDLYSFNATIVNRAALLNWSTVTEQDNKGFSILRSLDGAKWEDVGFVHSKSVNGNSASTINYTHIDDSALNGTIYYRLKKINFNGDFSYSKTEKVTFENLSRINIHPNPVNDRLELKGVSNNDEIVIFNSLGEILINNNNNNNSHNVSIDVKHLATGTYFLKISSTDKTAIILKFVKL